jgi:hypothetical protein
MAINTNPSSRRALLAGTAAGLAVAAAGQLARPLSALAADGDVVHVGDTLAAESTTSITNSTTSETVLVAESVLGSAIDANSRDAPAIHAVSDTEVAISAVSKQHVGIVGYGGEPGLSDPRTNLTGVMGQSHAGYGVAGMSKSGEGVHASSETGSGVYAYSPTGFGLDAASDSGIAVRAFSKKTGVHGITEGSFDFGANRDVVGVLGISRSVEGVGGNGPGVEGRSETGIGVLGSGKQGVHGASGSDGGTGVLAKSETGAALNAIAVYPEQGARAIVAEGPVEFSSAGRGIIARGATQARVTSPVALDAAVSKILVTLLANPAGKMPSSLSHVKFDGSQAFTVVLTAPAAREVPFAYFVLG